MSFFSYQTVDDRYIYIYVHERLISGPRFTNVSSGEVERDDYRHVNVIHSIDCPGGRFPPMKILTGIDCFCLRKSQFVVNLVVERVVSVSRLSI